MVQRGLLAIAALLSFCLGAGQASASVEISFYSRELGGNNFPHAFIKLKGVPEAGGDPVDISYGFTAKTVSPAVLMGSVGGMVMNEPAGYVAKSDRQFTLVLADEQYWAVMGVISKWKNKPQPSYNLNRANCVHFVREIARAAGLKVAFRKELMKKPRSFLREVKSDNVDLISKGRPSG